MTKSLQLPEPRLVLASASAVRKAMLEAAGLAFAVVPAVVDEESWREALAAEGVPTVDAATALAEAKGLQVAQRLSGDLVVIAADQLLELDGRWLDKAVDQAAARERLLSLAGRTHRLASAAVAFRGGARVWHHVDVAEVTFRACSAAAIDAYLAAAAAATLRSVGAYELEGLGAQLITKVEGSHFTVLGLPLLPLLQFLRDQKVLLA